MDKRCFGKSHFEHLPKKKTLQEIKAFLLKRA
jgi:hypothetical protein